MNQLEALLLRVIAEGAASDEELLFKLEEPQRKTKSTIERLLMKNLIYKIDKLYHISKRGLLEYSRYRFKEKCRKNVYTSLFMNDQPYLPYLKRFKKDTVFCPDTFFDCAINEVTGKPVVYEIKIENHDIDLDLLEVVSNLLEEYSAYHLTGFWVLNLKGNSVCGYNIQSLRRTVELFENARSFVFVIGFQDFIIIAKSKDPQVGKKIDIKFYLTRSVFPYIDTIDMLFNALKIFWLIIGLKQIPRGQEIELTSKQRVHLKKPLSFIPTVWGKIYWTSCSHDSTFTYPEIIAFDSREINIDLKKVTPWFSRCAGGLLEEDINEKRPFGFYSYEFTKLPDINLVHILLHAK